MAVAVFKAALGYLGSLAATELGIFLGFNREKEKLDSMFTSIEATLQDAEEKQFSHKKIKDWLRKLTDAAYELDDVMDECVYEELRLKHEEVNCCLPDMVVPNSSLSTFHPVHLLFRYKIAKRMKSISDKLDQIAKEKDQLDLIPIAQETTSGILEWRQTISSITEPKVYGREKDTINVVDFLIGDANASHSEKLSVYPILGQGGLGKTTLAQTIFNHERVTGHFEPKIWVCVSEDFNFKKMVRAIIEAVSGQACEDLALEQLRRRLVDLLQGKKYFLVLDDVWDDKKGNWQEDWRKLKSILACGEEGTSILVTTRLGDVATIMGTTHPPELAILSFDDCWKLFKHYAFGLNEVQPEELVDTGRDIVKKCGGVPLAAKALGGLLSSERRKQAWVNIKDSSLWSSTHNIMPALKLSYSNLPVNLRQCFAYCAMFPKDRKIEKQNLIELWVANRFVSSQGTLAAEDVGDRAWNELCSRSFFQDIKIDEFGKVTSFRMHDLVHDLAQYVADEVCCITDVTNVTTLPERIHHLSDHTEEAINPSQLNKVKSLRTFICCYNTDQLCPHVLKYYSLRALHCEEIRELSSLIGDLKLLRYLNLSGGDFKTLPESLCKLWNLQILKLDDCFNLQELPNTLINLEALQQLSFNGCRKLKSLPPHIGRLTSLRSLSKYFVGNKGGFLLAELGPLKLKGDLYINHLGKVKSVEDAKEADMSSKQVNMLWLLWDSNEESELQNNVEEILEELQPDTQQLHRLGVVGYKGVQFPQWVFSPSLKKLSIVRCSGVKGLHEALQHMTLLQELHLLGLPNLESLPDCFENLPLLQQLTISNCDKLRRLPTSLSHSSLKSLTIWGCDELEKQCEKEIGEDWPKIAHIPGIMIRRRHR